VGNCGVELNAVSSFRGMTGPGLVSMDPLAPMPDPSTLSDAELVSLLNPTTLSDAELVSSSDPPSLSDAELPCCLSDAELVCSSSWKRRSDDSRKYQKGSHHCHQQGCDDRRVIDGRGNHHIVIIIITFDGTEFTPLGSGNFLGWIGRA
jgi:hypothetical protein